MVDRINRQSVISSVAHTWACDEPIALAFAIGRCVTLRGTTSGVAKMKSKRRRHGGDPSRTFSCVTARQPRPPELVTCSPPKRRTGPAARAIIDHESRAVNVAHRVTVQRPHRVALWVWVVEEVLLLIE